MSCLGPEGEVRETPPAKVVRLVAVIVASPEPDNYEESALGNATLRKDVTVWREGAMATVKGGGE